MTNDILTKTIVQRQMFEALGDRMKFYESAETDRAFAPHAVVVVRLDGRAFHTFTRGLGRPYSASFGQAMIETAKHMVESTHANLAYTQSDEISLVYLPRVVRREKKPDVWGGSSLGFGGRVQKVTSVFAGSASSRFAMACMNDTGLGARAIRMNPHFDARCFQVPTVQDAALAILWRYMDARRNAVSMLAQAHFSQRKLQGKPVRDQLQMLKEAGVSMASYPSSFVYGSLIRRRVVSQPMDESVRVQIPSSRRPARGVLVDRNEVYVSHEDLLAVGGSDSTGSTLSGRLFDRDSIDRSVLRVDS